MLATSSQALVVGSSCQARGAVRASSRLAGPVPSSTWRAHRQQSAVVFAGSDDKSPAAVSTSSSEVEEAEARIAALEAQSRKARSKRQIPIRNMTPRPEDNPSDSRAEWRKGQLFPEGWEQMDLGQKAYELYLGRRGFLFWATELSWKGAIVLGVAWVLFRLGGAAGLYQLQGDLLPPPV